MVNHSNSKVLGAFVVGAILVGGSYLAANLKPPTGTNPASLSVTTVESPLRVPIAVQDSNNDGIEDWQEVFISDSPFTNSSTTDYLAPDTLTGSIGVSFFEQVLSAEAYKGIGRSREQIIEDTITKISTHATDKVFTVNDLNLKSDTSAAAIKAYANAHAEAIINNGIPGLRNELDVIREVLNGKTEPGLQELELISKVYLNTRDQVLLISVPNILAKEHLDLINVYSALYNDITAMTKVVSDPMLTFVRMKRYQEDVAALKLSLQNLFLALKPYTNDFGKDDKALLFTAFNPDLR
ncbi:MAG TPA: hypothetical protein PKA42_00500 [Candidatus Paceibacterota bacterium]|nr:hypothetical protein [Candidatus Paceibacterota bacterium]HMO82625.1 hypothetical protein [Candidatus Paceibacterota bacterium]